MIYFWFRVIYGFYFSRNFAKYRNRGSLSKVLVRIGIGFSRVCLVNIFCILSWDMYLIKRSQSLSWNLLNMLCMRR